MASLHICKPRTNHIYQSQTNFSPKITYFITKTPSKLKSSTSLQLQRLVLKSHAQIVSYIDNKPSTSSSLIQQQQQEIPLNIGIIGLGAFGQFLANAFQRQGHHVLGTSRSDYTEYCQERGIQFFKHLNDLCDAQPDVLLVCSSIVSTEDVVRGIPFHRMNPNTIIADVLSVKQFPKNLLLDVVPPGFGILCTHPMFGKYSGKTSWEGLRFVYEKVRVSGSNSNQARKCEQFLRIFEDEGCKMVEMTCEEHDQYAAESQFVTHTVARILSHMNIEATPIDTKGYETLMELTKNTVSHGNDLYDGLFLYNVNSAKQIQKLDKAFDKVKHNLFAKLRESFSRQMEESVSEEKTMAPSQSSPFLPSSEKDLKDVASFSMLVNQKSHATQ